MESGKNADNTEDEELDDSQLKEAEAIANDRFAARRVSLNIFRANYRFACLLKDGCFTNGYNND